MKTTIQFLVINFIGLLLFSCSNETIQDGSFTLTTQVNPADGGSVSPSTDTYTDGTSVSLTATANNNYAFKEWSGSLTGTTNPISVTMNENKNFTAVFELIDSDGDADNIDNNGDKLIAQGTVKSRADYVTVIYEAPYGTNRIGNLLCKCEAEELIGTAYDESEFRVYLTDGTTQILGCKLGQISALEIPAVQVASIDIVYSGVPPQDSHQTSYWIYDTNAEGQVLKVADTYKTVADVSSLVYDVPVGTTDTGNLTCQCNAEVLNGSYDESIIIIGFTDGRPKRNFAMCHLNTLYTLDIPIELVSSVEVHYSGIPPQDNHETAVWVYNYFF